jgi:hypothetical protein
LRTSLAIRARRQKARAGVAERKRQAALTRARLEEAKAEFGAPKIQREAVFNRNGEIIRGPRVEPDGLVFIRSNPVKHLYARSKNKDHPTIHKAHVDAAEKLLIAWEEGSQGISVGSSNYGERSAGAAVNTGTISHTVLQIVNQQIKARQEIAAVQAFLGALWPVIHAIVIRGIDIATWAEASGMRPAVATGYLCASLDKLLDFFHRNERVAPNRIRSVEIVGQPEVRK